MPLLTVSQAAMCLVLSGVGANFFLLFMVFSLTCYRVFFYFSLSGILLITLLCYVLYVNFVIVYYLALIYYQFYGSISVTTFVEVGFFLGGPDHQPRLPQHLEFIFFYGLVIVKHLLLESLRVVFGIGPCPFILYGIGPCPFIWVRRLTYFTH